MTHSPSQSPTFSQKLNAAIARNNSLLCIGLDPSPSFLPWDKDSNRQGIKPLNPQGRKRSVVNRDSGDTIPKLRQWLLDIIADTADLVCAYKPTLDVYLALGAPGLQLFEEILDAIPDNIPVILDVKHGDWITSGLFSRTAFDRWQVDALNIVPFSGVTHCRTVFGLSRSRHFCPVLHRHPRRSPQSSSQWRDGS